MSSIASLKLFIVVVGGPDSVSMLSSTSLAHPLALVDTAGHQ